MNTTFFFCLNADVQDRFDMNRQNACTLETVEHATHVSPKGPSVNLFPCMTYKFYMPTFSKTKVPVRAASPTPSDSSKEVILFYGRNKPKTVDDSVMYSRDTSNRRQEAPS